MFDAPSAPPSLTPAPGARGAKLCGIWSLIASCTCVGLPIGFVLAIVALVQQAKAKRLAKEHPDFYEQPTATGLVTGIIGLAMPVFVIPFVGIVSAIAIPALLSQRARARDISATMNTIKGVTALVAQYERLVDQKIPKEQIPSALETFLKRSPDKNPWNALEPAYSAHIEIASSLDQDEVGQMAASEAIEKGQSVWVIELPAGGRPGFISGAVRLENGTRTNPYVKTIEVE